MRKVFCAKYHENLEGLEQPPYPGELGRKIFESISKKAWDEWMEHQKQVINELKLAVFKPEAQEILRKQAEDFFFNSPDQPQGAG